MVNSTGILAVDLPYTPHFHYEIDTPTKKQSRKLLKDILSLVKEGRDNDAALAAECGRALSPFERALYFHYVTLHKLDLYMKNKVTRDPVPKYLELKRQEEAHLCSVFLEAIRKRDGDDIWKIAQAVWFLKGVFESKTPVDKARTHLLSIRGCSESFCNWLM